MAQDPAATPTRTLPAPAVNPETKAFWDAAREGRFMVGRCQACGRAHYYPRSICPFCFGESRLEAASGEGEIYAFSVTYRGAPEPYAIGYVALKEGPRILTNFVDCRFDDLKIGMPVKLKWTLSEGGVPVPTFVPA